MKKICFLSGDMSRSGGTERVLAIIANELCKKEDLFEIHILSTVNEKNISFFKIDSRIKQNRILNSKSLNFKKQYFKVVKGIRDYIKENSIDVFIDVEVISSIFSIPATRFTKTKHIAWEHFNFYENNGSSLRALARKIDAKFSDYIITLTEEDKNNYLNNLKIIGKIDYIYNPMEIKEVKKCSLHSKQIVSVGRLTYQKGFDMLIDVAKDVLEKNKEYKWLILGDGEDKNRLQEKINKYNLQDRLILKGKVSNVEDYYKNSSLYVMTSRFEGLPMTLLEAKSYKMPIVSFDCPTGPSEIIRNNINGYLVKANDIKEMSNKVNSVLLDDKKLKKFSDKAELDIDKFNINSIINKWTNILCTI
ncbi:glycosyltransferase family 4 protein [uncultured Clostridium sp.]|uniref:glycosyltransferase family 4 protein n=1 Tax=uncultured Clostridium sp. TaxID=59620 RepID=UPI00267281F8|nr:glycosyltransferase family 4 protein [uncultured Clostridium sp.]